MSKVLVTGAHGFIGSHLVNKLKGRHDVKELDRSQWSNIDRVVRDLSPDYIYHLAAYGNHYHQDDIKKTYKVNVLNLLDLLKAANNIKYKALINVGTSSEYGKKDKPMKESDSPDPTTFYAASKVAGTYLAKVWAEKFNKPIVTVRPFSVYGPGEDDTRFIPTIIRCVNEGKVLKLAPGVHDWIYVDDFTSGMLLAAQNAEKLRGQIINIGTGRQYTNKEVVKTVERVTEKKVRVEKTGKIRDYDTTVKWQADNNKLKDLGWQQGYTLKQGITQVVESIK